MRSSPLPDRMTLKCVRALTIMSRSPWRSCPACSPTCSAALKPVGAVSRSAGALMSPISSSTMTDVLVLSLVELPRQLGATLHHDIEWTAPDDLGTPSMRVDRKSHV